MNKINFIKLLLGLLLLLGVSNTVFSQEMQQRDVSQMSKNEILSLTYNDLMELPLEDLMKMADIVGMSTEELLQMAIVSASRQKESLIDAPLGASVISGDMIKNSGATSIPEALRLVPGVIVREQTPGNYDVHLRGFDSVDPNGLINWTSNNLTLVMINNRIVYNEYQGNTTWELLQVSIDDIQQIEVIRGPAAALYGPNAVTGVINIITKNPNKQKGLQVGSYSQMGTNNTQIGSLSVGYKFNNPFSVRVTGQYEHRDRQYVDYYLMGSQPVYDANGNYTYDTAGKVVKTKVGFVPELITTDPVTGKPYHRNVVGQPLVNADEPYMVANDPSSGWKYNLDERFPDPNQSLERYTTSAHINYNKNKVDINLMGGIADALAMKAVAITNSTALSNDDLTNAFAHLYGSVSNLSFNFDTNWGEFANLGSGSSLDGSYKIYGGDMMYNLQLGKKFNLKPGATFRTASYFGRILGSEGYDYTTYQRTPGAGDRTNTTLSGYLRGEFKSGNTRIIGALRADNFKYPGKTTLSPQIIFTNKPMEDLVIRASYGRAYRSPFMINLFTDLDMQYSGYPVSQGISNLSAIRQSYGMSSINTVYNVSYRGTELGYDDASGQHIETSYELLQTDEFEIGIRHKINSWISFDGEVFRSQLKNLDVFAKVVGTMEPVPTPANLQAYYLTSPDAASHTTFNVNTTTSLTEAKVNPIQYGTTLSFFGQPAANWDYSVFATFQETYVKDYYSTTPDPANPLVPKIDVNAGVVLDHTATPSYYGGATVNYRPIKKLNLNVNSYFYGAQTLKLSSGTETIEEPVKANVILNATAAYKVREGIKVFMSAKNFATSAQRQYALSDQIGATYLVGINLDL